MKGRNLILSSLITAAVAFAVFVIVRFIAASQLSAGDVVSALVVGLASGASTFILFRSRK